MTPTSAQPPPKEVLTHCAKRRAEDHAAKLAREASPFDSDGDVDANSDSDFGDGYDDDNRPKIKTVKKVLADQPKVFTEEQVRAHGLHRIVVSSKGPMGISLWLDTTIIPKLDATELPPHLRPFVPSSSVRKVKAAIINFDADSFASALLAAITYDTTMLEGSAYARACDNCSHFNKTTKSYRPCLVATKAGTGACQPCVDGHRACSLDPLGRDGVTNDFKVWLYATLSAIKPAGSLYSCPPWTQLINGYEATCAPNKATKCYRPCLVSSSANCCKGCADGHRACSLNPLGRVGVTNDFKIWLFATLSSLNPVGSIYACPPFAQLTTAYELTKAPNKVLISAQDKMAAAALAPAASGVNTGSGSGSGGGGYIATHSRPLPCPFPTYTRPTNPPSDELDYALAYHVHVENEALRTSFEVLALSGKPSNGTKRHSSGRAEVSSKASGSKSKVDEKVSGDIKGKAKAEDDDFILISSSDDG